MYQCISDCRLPHSIKNDNVKQSTDVKIYQKGTRVTISCDDGFRVHGNDTIQCLSDGQWDATVPVCKGGKIVFCYCNKNIEIHVHVFPYPLRVISLSIIRDRTPENLVA